MKGSASLLAVVLSALACGGPGSDRENRTTGPSLGESDGDAAVVQVAAPTGNAAVDVPRIRSAIEAAKPGSTVQFAQGTYRIEATTHIGISTPRITLQGHSSGTTIRGVNQPGNPAFLVGHFWLSGGRQTVRGLNFEGFGVALSFGEAAPAPRTGGYRLENSTFKNGDVAFETVTFSDEVSTIQGNRFINVTIPFFITGKTFRVLENTHITPNPKVTPPGRPFNAGVVAPEFWSSIVSDGEVEVFPCLNNTLASNTVSGNADGFILDNCSNGVVRRNSFVRQRLFPGDDEIPSFDDASMVIGVGPGFQGNLIESNEFSESPGIGIIVEEGSGNRILRNKFERLLPGKLPPLHSTITGLDLAGTAILLSEAAAGNRVCGNEFSSVAHTVVDLGPEEDNLICARDQEDDEEDARIMSTGRTGRAVRAYDHPKLRHLQRGVK